MKGKEKPITVIIAVICLLSAAAFLLYPRDKGRYAVICADGKTVIRKNLSETGSFTCPEIPDMEFEISANGIKVTESDCPDKICIKTGYIKNKGEAAVCMPNRVIVTVEGDDNEE